MGSWALFLIKAFRRPYFAALIYWFPSGVQEGLKHRENSPPKGVRKQNINAVSVLLDPGTYEVSVQRRNANFARIRQMSWFRLSEQKFRVDKWSLCRG